jgi:hypothetical protein
MVYKCSGKAMVEKKSKYAQAGVEGQAARSDLRKGGGQCLAEQLAWWQHISGYRLTGNFVCLLVIQDPQAPFLSRWYVLFQIDGATGTTNCPRLILEVFSPSMPFWLQTSSQ